MDKAPLVEIRNLLRRYSVADGTVAIEVLVPALDLFPGDRLALVAPSGAGKTTLLNMLLLAIQPTAADQFTIRTPGQNEADVTQLWSSGNDDRLGLLRARLMSFVLQSGGLFPFLSARENILLPSRLNRIAVLPETLEETVGTLGIGHVLNKRPTQLSGGERQRVAVARALVGRPPLLIADEPTASLDKSNAEVLLELISDLCRQSGTCLVLASHDTGLIDQFGLERLVYRSGVHPDGHTVSAFWRDGMVEETAP